MQTCHYTAPGGACRSRAPCSIESSIPVIDVSSLFLGEGADRATASTRRFWRAAASSGLFSARGNLPQTVPIDRESRCEAAALVSIAGARDPPPVAQKFDPSHANVYRGWFPLQAGFLTSKEGIDLGPDVAYGSSLARERRSTARGDTVASPSKRCRAGARRSPITITEWSSQPGTHALHCARACISQEHFFDDAFDRGLSTLRLIRYPPRTDLQQAAETDPSVWVVHRGEAPLCDRRAACR